MTFKDADLSLTLSASRKADAASNFARSGVIRIPDLFSADVAEALHRHFDSQLEWSRTVSQGDIAWDMGPEAMAAMEGGKFIATMHNTASDGFQFLFDSVIVSEVADERNARGLLLDRVIEALNHPDSLDTFRAITGAPDIRVVDGQATRYLPGHFLTSHDDGINGQGRVAAYVINLTKGWLADWGIAAIP